MLHLTEQGLGLVLVILDLLPDSFGLVLNLLPDIASSITNLFQDIVGDVHNLLEGIKLPVKEVNLGSDVQQVSFHVTNRLELWLSSSEGEQGHDGGEEQNLAHHFVARVSLKFD